MMESRICPNCCRVCLCDDFIKLSRSFSAFFSFCTRKSVAHIAQIIELLLLHGANVNAMDLAGQTPLAVGNLSPLFVYVCTSQYLLTIFASSQHPPLPNRSSVPILKCASPSPSHISLSLSQRMCAPEILHRAHSSRLCRPSLPSLRRCL